MSDVTLKTKKKSRNIKMVADKIDIEENTSVRGCGRFFVLGIPNALLSFAQASTGIILTDLIVHRTCLASLNINQTQCIMLHTNSGSPEAKNLETTIEPYASMIVMTKSVIESILPGIISLFIGPWSDRSGRRPVIMSAFAGFIAMFATLSLMCNWNIAPWYLLLCSIPAFMMGGSCTITLASNCHISDTTVKKDRTVLLAWLQISIFSGVMVGIMAGPAIYKIYGYTAVFSVATMCCTLALLHTYFFVPESVKNVSEVSWKGLFKISFLKEIVMSSTKKRNGFNRSVVWLGIFIFTVSEMINKGDMTIGFLFTRTRLGWDVQQFSYFGGAGLIFTIIGLSGVSLLSSILGISDTFLVGIGLISALGCSITKSLATTAWHMYLAVAIAMFNGIVGPVTRSVISKVVPPDDVGKVFSLMGLLETLSPMGGAPLLTLIYTRYLPPIYPSPVYLFCTGCSAILILCLVYIEILFRRSRKLIYIPAAQEDAQL